MGRREIEILLEGASRGDYRIVFHLKCIELKRYGMMRMVHHLRRMRLVEGIVIQISIMLRIVRYHYAVDCGYLRGKVRWSLEGL